MCVWCMCVCERESVCVPPTKARISPGLSYKCHIRIRFYMKCVSIQKISGNEVHYPIFYILLVKIMLCSKLHCQKSFKLKHMSYKIPGRLPGACVLHPSVTAFPRYGSNPQGRSRYQTSEFPTTSECPTTLPTHTQGP